MQKASTFPNLKEKTFLVKKLKKMNRNQLKNTLFDELTTIFLGLGFQREQILVMDNITAGDYIVAHNPTLNIPRL